MSKLIQFIDNLKTKIYSVPYYPVGSIFITVDNTNPSRWFGGTWVIFGSGRTLVGVDTSQTEFNTVQKTGGEKTHTLTMEEMVRHNHVLVDANNVMLGYGSGVEGYGRMRNTSYDGTNIAGQYQTNFRGESKPHNNLQPYITVYLWRKTAM